MKHLTFAAGVVVGVAVALALPSVRGQDATDPPRADDPETPGLQLRAPVPLTPPARTESRGEEILRACAQAGLKVRGVSFKGGEYRLACDEADQARATAIMREVLTKPKQSPKVRTLQDALTVIQFEPENAEARKRIREHYDALCSSGSEQER